MAFYSLVTELKIWEKEGFSEAGEDSFGLLEKELKKSQSALRYWILSEKIRRSRNPLKKIWYKLLRKI
jgi:hypothetical protein